MPVPRQLLVDDLAVGRDRILVVGIGEDRVSSRAAVDGVPLAVTRPDRVRAAPAENAVLVAPSVYGVGTGEAAEHVVLGGAYERVRTGRAVDGRREGDPGENAITIRPMTATKIATLLDTAFPPVVGVSRNALK